MTTDNKSSLTLIIGIALGAFIVYMFLKNKTSTPSPQIQTFNSSSMENRLDSIEQQLQQIQQIQLQQLNSPSQQIQTQPIQQIQQPIQQTNTNMLYKNNESWEIVRGKDGFISKLNVLRDVKLNK